MPVNSSPHQGAVSQKVPPYAWVIVAATALIVGTTYGLTYSYGVIFKPLVEYFNWNRATVSLVYSTGQIMKGVISIGAGWLADKYGVRKVLVTCGFIAGLGLVLSSRVTELWQFFLSYGVIHAIGLSGTFGICTTVVAYWFTKNRGLAMGIMASGSGLGTFFIVPAVERLLDAYDWSRTLLICGIAAGVLMVGAAATLREPPWRILATNTPGSPPSRSEGATVREGIRDPRLFLVGLSFMSFFFGMQIVMVHLVNHATDIGIDPLVAATFISVIGIVSIVSRLGIGVGSDKVGIYGGLLFTRAFLVISFILLLFVRSTGSFYLFAVLFSIPYGGEITQTPLVISKYFGTRAMATLMGINLFFITLGGTLGPWLAGEVYDSTSSYDWAFIAGAIAAAFSILMVLLTKWYDETHQRPRQERLLSG